MIDLLIEKFKIEKIQIEILWCFLGGLGFVVLSALFQSATQETVLDDIFELREWNIFERRPPADADNFLEFIFGFIITGIIIWSIKTYKKL